MSKQVSKQVSKRTHRETETDNNEESQVTVSESVKDKLRSANEFLTRLAEQFGYLEP